VAQSPVNEIFSTRLTSDLRDRNCWNYATLPQFTVNPTLVVADGFVASELLSVKAFTAIV
jgi:hypothetical protein